jgi:hypothetical protein
VILVDTNVVLDVLSDDDHWRTWSKARLISAARQDGLAINDIVYAELSIGYDDLRSSKHCSRNGSFNFCQSRALLFFKRAKLLGVIGNPAARELACFPTSS